MLRHQFQGVLNLSLPFVPFYFLFPQFALSLLGIAFYFLVVGIYVGYVTYTVAQNKANQFSFIPTGLHSKQFTDEIMRCGLDPKRVLIRYAYADDGIALTFINTIAVDPMLWSTIQDDPEALKARAVVEQHVIPTVDANKRELHGAIKSSLSEGAQKFIFRHELAHVFYNYSIKRSIIAGLVGVIVAALAFVFARNVIAEIGGFGAFSLGVCLAVCVDLLFAYMINFFFKSYEEKRADLFAAQFSTKDTLDEAADFFEQYEKAAQKYRDTIGNIIDKLPTTISIGYIDGVRRAQYLRKIAQSKGLS